MFLVDTNVVSELMRPEPNPFVLEWIAFQEYDTLALSTIGIAETLKGLSELPEGRRKNRLQEQFDLVRNMIEPGNIWSFDEAAAFAFPMVCRQRFLANRHIDLADAQIAAIARAKGATVVTRNIKHFEDTGIDLTNPFAPA